MITETEAAYAAGFFDGEGAVMIWRRNGDPKDGAGRPFHRLVVSINNTDPRPLEWLKARFGGTSILRMNSAANIAKKNKPVYQWVLSARSAAAFLRRVRPYLHIKGERADLALAFQATMSEWKAKAPGVNRVSDETYAIRQGFREHLMLLNKKGVA